MSSLLQLDHVSHRFGGVVAIDDLSLSIGRGEIVGLIGPNGAGKTTLINLITGLLKPGTGTISFEGQPISSLPAHRLARMGIARTYQIVQPFPLMTVLENVAAAALFCGKNQSLARARASAREALAECGLESVADASAAALSLAQRKRLEFAKALAMRPRLLLLDEVNAGLNATELDNAMVLIRSLSERGVTVVLVEHLMRVVLGICGRIVVLHQGRLIADGTPDAVVRDAGVIGAYLGRRYADAQQANGGATS